MEASALLSPYLRVPSPQPSQHPTAKAQHSTALAFMALPYFLLYAFLWDDTSSGRAASN